MSRRDFYFAISEEMNTPKPFSVSVNGASYGFVPNDGCDLETFRLEVRTALAEAFNQYW